MYSQWINTAFVQLRKQYYKLKTRESIDRYSKIEMNKKHYRTFMKFCDSIEQWNAKIEYYEDIYDIQSTFDTLLDLSQKNTLKFYIQ